jgi:hypothetical protein
LGGLIAQVGIELAKACDVNGFSPTPIAPMIERSRANKARLLHYFPSTSSSSETEAEGAEGPEGAEGAEGAEGEAEGAEDDACGVHLDHSLLTGLCSAQYLSPTPNPTSPPSFDEVSPNPKAGLYIYPRQRLSPEQSEKEIGLALKGKSSVAPVKVSIPKDCLAFQTGEALSVLTQGRLSATPHFVASGRQSSSRETFAFFLQPDVGDDLGGETFGEFTKRVLKRHYA